MRNASKWFLCFRPPSTIEIDDGVDCSAERVLSLIAAARNSNRLKNKRKKENKKMLPKTKAMDSSILDPNLPPSTSRRSFASVVRAVVFETSLSRRVREAKLRKRSDRSAREPPSDEDIIPVTHPKTSDQISQIAVDLKSNTNQAPGSDSRFTSTTAEGAKQSEIGTGSGGKINPVVFLMLLSLLVTVFCGRLCAVMTTTVWIYAWQSGALALVVGLGEMLKSRRKGKPYFPCKRKAID
ncbi:hypothetical protein V2J09_009027 [Rumex salicifolius]